MTEDCISRQAALDCLTASGLKKFDFILDTRNKIKKLPSIDLQPKIGYWIKHEYSHSVYFNCCLCGCVAPCTETADELIWKLSSYCPDCGAKMENGGEWYADNN